MKYAVLTLTVLTLSYAGLGHAKDDKPPVGCSSWGQIPTSFIEKCALAGGDEVRCSGSTPMCCKKNAQGGTNCYDNPDDVKKKFPGANVPTAPGSNQLAPPKTTAPKMGIPGAQTAPPATKAAPATTTPPPKPPATGKTPTTTTK